MSLFTRSSAPFESFAACIQRAKKEGSICGSREAKLFRLAMGKVAFARDEAHSWLNTVVNDGRAELEAQHALEREVEAWDMSCRIAFMIEIV
jgi:hypothetical protein